MNIKESEQAPTSRFKKNVITKRKEKTSDY